MRKLIIAASTFALAAPAFAQAYPDPRDDEVVRSLPAPGEIDAMGDRVGAIADAILDTPVGPLREAIEGRRLSRRERDETLGDVASRDDPYARDRVRDEIAIASAGVGSAVEQLAVLTPVLRRSLEDAARRMEDAIAQSRARRGERRYDPDLEDDWER
ncbi:hypothetical protein [Allosphingosinicella deserti]|uniref:Uncharacterized protein n=1 Tax=Allosphingosinicella deserti TaxID=2116704 RepID=A0A2P7QZA7_9SPHN|nr:hypothetical protein [Sphingomonas deserti]PSJ43298.1 hypothetical protein C7I55_02680 [Sphingomonas deserti]